MVWGAELLSVFGVTSLAGPQWSKSRAASCSLQTGSCAFTGLIRWLIAEVSSDLGGW